MAASRASRLARRPGFARELRRHLASRPAPLADAILAFPLFLTYQLGILLGASRRNGVDFATDALIRLSERSPGRYLLVLLAMTLTYAAVLAVLRRRGASDARRFGPLLAESSVYALLLGSVILAVMQIFERVLPGLAIVAAGPLDVVVISAGAGFHEELVFRLVGLSGGAVLLSRLVPRSLAWPLALALSSLAFAAIHHVGQGSDPIELGIFAYRSIAGVLFGVLFQLRGFAVAAWTHALYDMTVIGFGSS